MKSENIRDLVRSVQTNCHISDARHGADYSLCVYLMKMREYYRWEQGLPYGAILGKDKVGDWLAAREQLWENLEEAEFESLEINGEHFDPFDAEAINTCLEPLGLVYSGGLGHGAKPHFVLGDRADPDQEKDAERKEGPRGTLSPPRAEPLKEEERDPKEHAEPQEIEEQGEEGGQGPGEDQTRLGEEGRAQARRLMTEEVNAAVRGACDAGATDVLVVDAHNVGLNLVPEALDERARLVMGSPRPLAMMEGVDRAVDAACFVGYHGMAGTAPDRNPGRVVATMGTALTEEQVRTLRKYARRIVLALDAQVNVQTVGLVAQPLQDVRKTALRINRMIFFTSGRGDYRFMVKP